MSLSCPYCLQGVYRRTRMHDDGIEYQCLCCGGRFTRRQGSDEYFHFFPGDIFDAIFGDTPPRFDPEDTGEAHGIWG